MSTVHRRLTLIVSAMLLAAVALPAGAESSAASSASNSASSAVGSLSTSIEKSSASSSGDNKVAAGDYKVIEVAALPTQGGILRVRLQAVADVGREFVLLLPQQAAARGRIEQGQVLSVAERDYGLAFATKADADKPFFLVLDDAWFRELQSRPV